jgi:hypothetical protein
MIRVIFQSNLSIAVSKLLNPNKRTDRIGIIFSIISA